MMNGQRKKKKRSTTPQVIQLDKQKHALMILRRFQEMQRENQACDVCVKVDGRSIPAHSEILCGASSYFKRYLRDENQSEVELLGVDFECAKYCVDYIYGRQLNVNPEIYESLLFVAHIIQLKELCTAIEKSMMENLTAATLLQYKNAATFYGCSKLKLKCERFSRFYFEDLTRADDFKEVCKENLLSLLKSNRSNMDDDDKLMVILRWVKQDKSRSSSLVFLLQGVDLTMIPLQRLHQILNVEDVIRENDECLEAFNHTIENYVEKPPNDVNFQSNSFLIFPRTTPNLQVFNPKTNELAEMPVRKCDIESHYSATIFEDSVYIFAEDQSLYKFCYWDEFANWDKLTDMKEKHGMYPPNAVSSRKIYVIGACGQGYASDAVERYHPDYKEWETLPSKPTKSDGAQIVSIDGSIYCIGGLVNNLTTRDLFRYDTKLFEWYTLSPMIEPRAKHSVAQWSGSIIAAGGILNQWNKHKSVERYDVETDQWTMLSNMKVDRVKFSLLPSDGFLFSVGGIGRKQTANVIERYDFKEDIWKVVKFGKETAPKVYQSVAVVTEDVWELSPDT